MKKIFVVSPLGAKTEEEIKENIKWTQKICRSINDEGYNVIAPVLLYPQWYSDTTPEERKKGIEFGLDWMLVCDEVRVFTTLRGISPGMTEEIKAAKAAGKPITYI